MFEIPVMFEIPMWETQTEFLNPNFNLPRFKFAAILRSQPGTINFFFKNLIPQPFFVNKTAIIIVQNACIFKLEFPKHYVVYFSLANLALLL